jgi:TolB protein
MGFIGRFCVRVVVPATLLLALTSTAQASFPGQNGKIAFAGSGAVYTIEPDGSGLSLVVGGARWPAWSADGRRLAYFVDRPDSRYGLNVATADGSGEATVRAATFSSDQFSSREDLFEEPAWSPDGITLAYEAIRIACSHPTCIFFADGIRGIGPDGSGDHLLRDFGAGDPSYSPDGTRIAWDDATAQASPPRVHVSNADGTGDTVLTADGNGFDPSWSPDGSRIAFVRTVDSGNDEIHVMNSDGSDKRRLTSIPDIDWDPVWSPDGTKIAWSRRGQLWVMNPDGTGQARVTPEGTAAGSPDWQPLTGPRREDFKNASHFCKAEREFLGEQEFKREYGNHGGCVTRDR